MKKGVIPVNILLEIVIGIIIVGLGLSIFFKMYHNTTRIDLDPVEKEQIKAIITSTTEKVVLPISTVNLKKGETKVIGIGIKNYDNEEITVSINYECEKDGINTNDINIKTSRNEGINIRPGGYVIKELVITPKGSASKGEYYCTINIEKNGEIYGKTQLLVVNIY